MDYATRVHSLRHQNCGKQVLSVAPPSISTRRTIISPVRHQNRPFISSLIAINGNYNPAYIRHLESELSRHYPEVKKFTRREKSQIIADPSKGRYSIVCLWAAVSLEGATSIAYSFWPYLQKDVPMKTRQQPRTWDDAIAELRYWTNPRPIEESCELVKQATKKAKLHSNLKKEARTKLSNMEAKCKAISSRIARQTEILRDKFSNFRQDKEHERFLQLRDTTVGISDSDPESQDAQKLDKIFQPWDISTPEPAQNNTTPQKIEQQVELNDLSYEFKDSGESQTSRPGNRAQTLYNIPIVSLIPRNHPMDEYSSPDVSSTPFQTPACSNNGRVSKFKEHLEFLELSRRASYRKMLNHPQSVQEPQLLNGQDSVSRPSKFRIRRKKSRLEASINCPSTYDLYTAATSGETTTEASLLSPLIPPFIRKNADSKQLPRKPVPCSIRENLGTLVPGGLPQELWEPHARQELNHKPHSTGKARSWLRVKRKPVPTQSDYSLEFQQDLHIPGSFDEPGSLSQRQLPCSTVTYSLEALEAVFGDVIQDAAIQKIKQTRRRGFSECQEQPSVRLGQSRDTDTYELSTITAVYEDVIREASSKQSTQLATAHISSGQQSHEQPHRTLRARSVSYSAAQTYTLSAIQRRYGDMLS